MQDLEEEEEADDNAQYEGNEQMYGQQGEKGGIMYEEGEGDNMYEEGEEEGEGVDNGEEFEQEYEENNEGDNGE